MKLPKVMIFDVGGTLLDTVKFSFEEGLKYLYNEVIAKKESYEEFLFFYERLEQQINLREISSIEVSFLSLLKYWYFIYGKVSDKNDEKIECEFAERVYQTTSAPHVKAFLELLKEKKVRCFVLSNSMFSSHEIEKELEKKGLSSYFEEIVSTADYVFRKPSDAIFLMYIKKLLLEGYSLEDICYIGNEKIKDIDPPLSLGINAIWRTNTSCKTKTYMEIKEYQELIDMWK